MGVDIEMNPIGNIHEVSKATHRLGMWARLGIVVTTLWMIGFSLVTYLNLVEGAQDQRNLAEKLCPTAAPTCLAQYMSDWARSSDLVLALYAIGIAASIAAAFWTMVATTYAVVKWVLAGRKR
jgi:uncharacterized membrane protein